MAFDFWRSVNQYHPRIGYTYIPGIKSRVPHESGGYLIRTNGSGFRCDREFAPHKPPGTRRVLLLGDSMTAGDGVSNGERFGDVLEELMPGVETFNYGMPGTGPDQQYLIWQEFVRGVEHDLLVISVYVENIVRVPAWFRVYYDHRGNSVIHAKPYFTLDDGRLELHHVPVPKEPRTKESLDPSEAEHVDWGLAHPTLRKVVKALGLRDLVVKLAGFQPVPDYDSPDNPRWRLMRAVLEEWIHASPAPVLLVPIPMFTHVEGVSDPTSYLARVRELAAAAGCALHDPLPDLMKHTPEERRDFRFKVDVHFTPAGHRAFAESLREPIQRLLGERQAVGSAG
jgi:carbamoyltransferase